MGLRQRRKLDVPGRGEVLGALLVLAAIMPTLLYYTAPGLGVWSVTTGRIVSVEFTDTHYNAPEDMKKVDIRYEFSVDGQKHSGAWSGMWPEIDSPNALPPDRLSELQVGKPLSVLYRPGQPSEFRIHGINRENLVVLAGLSTFFLFASLWYWVRAYPALRR